MNEKIIGAEEELYLAPQTTESAAVSNEGISLLCDTENNSMQTAADITFKNWIQGQITCPEEEQWYRFTANGETAHLQGESGRYVICTAGEIDVEGYLYNSAGQQMVYNNRLGGLCIIDDLEYNQTYYLCIKSKDGNIGRFCVKADYMSATESGAYMESAIEIPFIADTVEDFCCPEHMIWYKFTANVPVLHKYAGKGKYSICGVSPESLIKGTLYTSSLNRVEPFYTENYAASFTNYYMLDEGETYYLLVSPSNGKKGRFRLNVTYDLNTSDNGNCIENAIPIMINNWQDGSIDVARQSKWYVFTVDGEYDKLTIHSDSTIRLEGELYDKDENFITSDNVNPERDDYITQTNFEIVRQLEDSATYYVCVTGIENNTGTFRIQLTDTVLAESISIEPKAYAIEVGETLTLQPIFVPQNTANKTLNWVSRDPSIASVNSNGVVTGKSHGNVQIYATTTDGTEKYDYCYVSVGEASEMVGLSRHTANLSVGESLTLTATVLPPIATVQSVNWTVSPQNVLRIDASDETTIKVTALTTGTATITAKSNDTYVSDSCEVRVVKYGYFNTTNKNSLTQEFVELLGNKKIDVPALDLFYINTTEECVNIIINHDNIITNMANELNVEKAFIQTILMRELWCLNLGDEAGDALVENYYAWRDACVFWESQDILYQAAVPYPTQPIPLKTDSSVGLGQIFASVAILAYNRAVNLNYVSGALIDSSDWKQCKNVWFSLKDNNEYNIRMSTLNILSCIDEFYYSHDYDTYSANQIKQIFTRYNEDTHTINSYGQECYEYYLIFKKYA